MDLTQSIVPKSDQINAEDLLTGPRTFTIEKVEAGSAEQPVNIHLVELPGRPYRPSKSMLRVLVSAWGAEANTYAGHRLTLFRNPEIRFGGSAVGGLEISHLSHLPKRLTVSLMVTRGKRKPFTVEPLTEPKSTAKRDFLGEAKAADGDMDLLRALWIDANEAGDTAARDHIAAMVAPVETPTSTL